MVLISIVFLVVWVVFSLLGFWKLSDPKRQVVFSGTLLVIAAGITLGVLRNVPLGAAVFGIGVIAALVRISRAWRHLPINRPH
ncbi:hypothetical protein [Streptomyces sp. NL15-2K]|uniref:hypothetical protein n=1 Tax=Streptomyces sp. NL15-2K TaxID=376149 RepID=UPI000F56E62F|nr:MULTISPECIES: hypothetical protein [Actinomycetes]WKX07260.1 hypothetical protein Q4V64_07075 [Kutzneria buriramensis]GCB51534.1 hypothetical protein SNL152K_8890 [Streptomyces sp. NL15-2K]